MAYRIYLDTEFIQHEQGLELVSIGLVKDSGETYYAISDSFDVGLASPWVQQYVLPALEVDLARKSLPTIAREIPIFVGNRVAEVWGFLALHDWWLVLQLFGGNLQNLPYNLPVYCKELQQEIDRLHFPNTLLPTRPTIHHALADAQWNRDVHFLLQNFENNTHKIPVMG